MFREEYGRAVAVLARHFGDIDIAEEAVQDAFTVAVQRWPAAGLPSLGSASHFQSAVWSQETTSKPRGTSISTFWL